jgi:glycolate oxidase iron-sulfur subunit
VQPELASQIRGIVGNAHVFDKYEDRYCYSGKTVDFTELLVDVGLNGNISSVNQTITYHEPCHLTRGSFSLQHYDLSLKINQHKVGDIAATGADTVVTGCPMCVMHMRDGLHQGGVETRVIHTAELLAEAYD